MSTDTDFERRLGHVLRSLAPESPSALDGARLRALPVTALADRRGRRRKVLGPLLAVAAVAAIVLSAAVVTQWRSGQSSSGTSDGSDPAYNYARLNLVDDVRDPATAFTREIWAPVDISGPWVMIDSRAGRAPYTTTGDCSDAVAPRAGPAMGPGDRPLNDRWWCNPDPGSWAFTTPAFLAAVTRDPVALAAQLKDLVTSMPGLTMPPGADAALSEKYLSYLTLNYIGEVLGSSFTPAGLEPVLAQVVAALPQIVATRDVPAPGGGTGIEYSISSTPDGHHFRTGKSSLIFRADGSYPGAEIGTAETLGGTPTIH
ncbi:MAG: hypothetical protein JWN20_2517 [Jatrophihabitantaceae bacterium]|nr:hypothetical protein [Jatrophihabitantaceae bacterium]